jgi:hypothetical protein
MARRDSFDSGHGMDHHKAMWKATRLAGGAMLGATMFQNVGGAIAGAAASHIADKLIDVDSPRPNEPGYGDKD